MSRPDPSPCPVEVTAEAIAATAAMIAEGLMDGRDLDEVTAAIRAALIETLTEHVDEVITAARPVAVEVASDPRTAALTRRN